MLFHKANLVDLEVSLVLEQPGPIDASTLTRRQQASKHDVGVRLLAVQCAPVIGHDTLVDQQDASSSALWPRVGVFEDRHVHVAGVSHEGPSLDGRRELSPPDTYATDPLHHWAILLTSTLEIL